MRRPILTPCLALFVLIACAACGESVAQVPPVPKAPKGLANFKMKIPEDNPLTAETVWLGKQLFFDKRLSSDGSMSCETCHVPEKGWSNGEAFSTKANGQKNTRNSPSLYNVGYQPYFYWDGRAPTLEANIKAAWGGHMMEGEGTRESVSAKLAEVEGYKSQFAAAFEDGAVSADNVVKALASFVRTIRSGNSDFDNKKLSAAAKKGQMTYLGRCGACHLVGLFTDFAFHNVGIGMDKENPDIGRGKHDEENPLMKGAFKTPSLRSITKSGPYFHDGSVADLREAVELMAMGGTDKATDPVLMAHKAMPKLTDEDIDNLVAFLQALEGKGEFERPELPK